MNALEKRSPPEEEKAKGWIVGVSVSPYVYVKRSGKRIVVAVYDENNKVIDRPMKEMEAQ